MRKTNKPTQRLVFRKPYDNKRLEEVRKKIKIYNNDYNFQVKGMKKDKRYREEKKMELKSQIVKDFYIGIKVGGYCSFIPNKIDNTVFTRKFHKKYDSVERLLSNDKFNYFTKSLSLPKIIDNYPPKKEN